MNSSIFKIHQFCTLVMLDLGTSQIGHSERSVTFQLENNLVNSGIMGSIDLQASSVMIEMHACIAWYALRLRINQLPNTYQQNSNDDIVLRSLRLTEDEDVVRICSSASDDNSKLVQCHVWLLI